MASTQPLRRSMRLIWAEHPSSFALLLASLLRRAIIKMMIRFCSVNMLVDAHKTVLLLGIQG